MHARVLAGELVAACVVDAVHARRAISLRAPVLVMYLSVQSSSSEL
jgi:hypothetical protein